MDSLLIQASIDNVAVLTQLVRQYHEFEQTPPYDEAIIEQALRPLLENPELGTIWLIQNQDKTIGYIALCYGYSLEFGGRDAFIDEFFIVSEQRGQGIGKRVLAQVKAEAWRSGIKALHLEVNRDNKAAQRLYNALGFQLRDPFMLMSQHLNDDD